MIEQMEIYSQGTIGQTGHYWFLRFSFKGEEFIASLVSLPKQGMGLRYIRKFKEGIQGKFITEEFSIGDLIEIETMSKEFINTLKPAV